MGAALRARGGPGQVPYLIPGKEAGLRAVGRASVRWGGPPCPLTHQYAYISSKFKKISIGRAMVLLSFFQDSALKRLKPPHDRGNALGESPAKAGFQIKGRLEEILLHLKNARRTTIILVTHDPAQAARLADHMLFLQDGSLAAP